MICHRCNSKMEKSQMDGVLIDKCINCNGVWLDAGELEMLVYEERKTQFQILTETKIENIQEGNRLITNVNACPKCQQTPLLKIYEHGVELDQCLHCKGIFFDDGELKKILTAEKKDFKHCIKAFFHKFKVIKK